MSASEPIDEAKGRRRFNNTLIADWDRAMDSFYTAVNKQAERFRMTPEEVSDALDAGYGWEVAEGWNEWSSEV